MLARHRITRYVEPLREGGSLPGLVEADDDGLYVVKLRGAGQGIRALVAELVVGELARAIGLRVPELVFLELGDPIGRAEPDPEIQELLLASVGENVGLDFLPASLPFAVFAGHEIPLEEAAAVVWLDLVTTNVDRTPRNSNLLWWHGQLWLIDHGAALYRHHAATVGAGEADRPFPQIVDHILMPLLGDDPAARLEPLRAAHARLAPLVTPEVLAAIVANVPDDWRGEHDYAGYLAERIAVVGRWLEAIDGIDQTSSATSGPGTGGLPRGPEAGKGLGPRVGAPPKALGTDGAPPKADGEAPA
ncbi:MAG: aminotransferase class I and II [Solirubrobacteraceae bacterium]|nr:aminotransferase class I and II [Solirubrobacteraceae bacterium]